MKRGGVMFSGGIPIGKGFYFKELVRFKEPLIANSIQVNALAQLLTEKEFMTGKEYLIQHCCGYMTCSF
jgi:hypothetical protein